MAKHPDTPTLCFAVRPDGETPVSPATYSRAEDGGDVLGYRLLSRCAAIIETPVSSRDDRGFTKGWDGVTFALPKGPCRYHKQDRNRV